MSATNSHISAATERELAVGVLNQATQDLRRFHGQTSRIERDLYVDAYGWVMSDDSVWPFSFLNVCQLLNLSPEDVRQDLLGDLSLGIFSQWTRRCGRAARRLKLHVAQRFTAEHYVGASETDRLLHTLP